MGCKDTGSTEILIEDNVTHETKLGAPGIESNGQADFKVSAKKSKSLNQSNAHLKKYTITKTNQKKFESWKHGAATIFLVTQPYKRSNKQEIEIGRFQTDGTFGFNLPASVKTDRPIADFFKCEGTAAVTTEYKAPKTGLVSAFFSIRKNENEIGLLSLATSRQQVYNNSPFGKYHGHSGYRLQFWYADANTGAYAVCNRNIEATDNAETTKQIAITDIYDLSFNQGWNYVKTEIIENQLVGRVPYYKAKKHQVSPSLPDDVKWVFKAH
ncbi:hypothetical protein DDV96_12830 [Marixanthomonas spongiae]|uniref:Uncharacterized protein n=2 Tax=Marixanthomonas spongiae TaxID=2174845 RepID=A0A2U0HXH5_9FLAO|nr:hypothetical protein DDV96_12830 [Marixanthomonas spongiae]